MITVAIAAAWPVTALAATQPRLGTAANFAVLAGSAITNTGPTVINGDVGMSPGGSSSVTGFPPGIINGGTHYADAVAVQAKNDLVTAYNDAAGQTPFVDKTGVNLGGQNLTPGTYHFSSSAQLTGTLTLSGFGVYIFQIGSTLTTASAASVLLTNGAQACGVYWQVTSSATFGSTTSFQGTVIALTSITMNTGATLIGRALARNGAVTLDSNTITRPAAACAGLPNTGAVPVRGAHFPWQLVVVGLGSGLGALVLASSIRARRRRSA
ncbi:MAG: ice-binding family protein [Chloroflexota bacterium]